MGASHSSLNVKRGKVEADVQRAKSCISVIAPALVKLDLDTVRESCFEYKKCLDGV